MREKSSPNLHRPIANEIIMEVGFWELAFGSWKVSVQPVSVLQGSRGGSAARRPPRGEDPDKRVSGIEAALIDSAEHAGEHVLAVGAAGGSVPPTHILRVTTAGRSACSARQFVASSVGSKGKLKMASNSTMRCC